MDVTLDKDEQKIVDTAAAFAREVVAPNAARWEQERRLPREAIEQAAEAGLCALLAPPEIGGAGLGVSAMARVMEELAGACFAFTFTLVVHNNLVGNIARNGTKAQIERYVSDMSHARRLGAFLLTEPGAGSDAAALATTAKRDGKGWVIDGEKAWVTSGAVADVLSVYAQTDAEAGSRGIACFLIDAETKGVARTPPYALMGGHAMGVGGFEFSGCHVGDEAVLIAPGAAFKAALAGIDIGRIMIAAMCCGMLRDGLDTAVAYASKRRAFGRATSEFQGVQWLLAEAATSLEASRLLTYEAARAFDAGTGAGLASAHAKKFASHAAADGLSGCMSAMGAAGARAEVPLGRHLANAKLAQFMDGTSEIQNVVIARALLRR